MLTLTFTIFVLYGATGFWAWYTYGSRAWRMEAPLSHYSTPRRFMIGVVVGLWPLLIRAWRRKAALRESTTASVARSDSDW